MFVLIYMYIISLLDNIGSLLSQVKNFIAIGISKPNY